MKEKQKMVKRRVDKEEERWSKVGKTRKREKREDKKKGEQKKRGNSKKREGGESKEKRWISREKNNAK